MRSKTDPRANPSCRLNVAENPMMGILCDRVGGITVVSGLRMLGSNFDSKRRYLEGNGE